MYEDQLNSNAILALEYIEDTLTKIKAQNIIKKEKEEYKNMTPYQKGYEDGWYCRGNCNPFSREDKEYSIYNSAFEQGALEEDGLGNLPNHIAYRKHLHLYK